MIMMGVGIFEFVSEHVVVVVDVVPENVCVWERER